jgi:acyl CoA:acetate/3-ketoacid CoA transferase alpha subunit
MHRIVGSWSDAMTDSDYIQDPPFWCGTTSSNIIASDVVINPHITHDLEILRVWKGNEAGNIGHKTYTDEEENAATINYLKKRFAVIEELFIEMVSKSKKKNSHKGVQVHNTRSSGRR